TADWVVPVVCAVRVKLCNSATSTNARTASMSRAGGGLSLRIIIIDIYQMTFRNHSNRPMFRPSAMEVCHAHYHRDVRQPGQPARLEVRHRGRSQPSVGHVP